MTSKASMMLSAIFVICLCYHSFQTIEGACPLSTTEAHGRCYQVNKHSLPWSDADTDCGRKKGWLAYQNFANLLNSGNDTEELPLRRDFCYWVENPKLELELFSKNDLLETFRLLWETFYCGLLCVKDGEWKTEKSKCTNKFYYICQHPPLWIPQQNPTSKPSSSAPRPLTHKKPFVKNKMKRQVVNKAMMSMSVVGSPAFVRKVPIVTMCSRICVSSKGCVIFNFNSKTLECRGYSKESRKDYIPHEDWGVWQIIYK